MAGKKRSRNGQVKPRNETQEHSKPTQDVPMIDPTPPCAQPHVYSCKSTAAPIGTTSMPEAILPETQAAQPKEPTECTTQAPSNSKRDAHNPSKRQKLQKLQKLPNHVTISKRPLLHPSLPSPFASSTAPKILYIKSNTPFIPALKRIRRLLSEISKREKQSLAATAKRRRPLEANGRLRNEDVEREVADEVAKTGKQVEGERVYLKATGRAIPRALELGVQFQDEADCVVRIEMGSVRAIDDIEVKCLGVEEEGGVDGNGAVEDDVPETRIRTISSLTVSIGLK